MEGILRFLRELEPNTIIGLATCLFTGYLAFFAWSQLKELRKQHKQKSTIELLISNNSNEYYRKRRKSYMTMRDSGVNLTVLACALNDKNATAEQKRQNFIVLDVLNAIEFICVGIKEDLFDEAVYKRMSKSSVIKDWNTLKPYIMELRRINNNNKLFCESEWLATKWESEQSK